MEYIQTITMLLMMDYHVLIGHNLGLYKIFIFIFLRESTNEYKIIELSKQRDKGVKIILDIYHV